MSSTLLWTGRPGVKWCSSGCWKYRVTLVNRHVILPSIYVKPRPEQRQTLPCHADHIWHEYAVGDIDSFVKGRSGRDRSGVDMLSFKSFAQLSYVRHDEFVVVNVNKESTTTYSCSVSASYWYSPFDQSTTFFVHCITVPSIQDESSRIDMMGMTKQSEIFVPVWRALDTKFYSRTRLPPWTNGNYAASIDYADTGTWVDIWRSSIQLKKQESNRSYSSHEMRKSIDWIVLFHSCIPASSVNIARLSLYLWDCSYPFACRSKEKLQICSRQYDMLEILLKRPNWAISWELLFWNDPGSVMSSTFNLNNICRGSCVGIFISRTPSSCRCIIVPVAAYCVSWIMLDTLKQSICNRCWLVCIAVTEE